MHGIHKEDYQMQEKLYKIMGKGGATSMAFGICLIVFSLAAGVMLIVNGAKLLVSRQSLEAEY